MNPLIALSFNMAGLCDIPRDILNRIGQFTGISKLTKICIASDAMNRLLGNAKTEIYKNLIKYEHIPKLLLEEACKYNSASLIAAIIMDNPNTAVYVSDIAILCWTSNYLDIFDFLHDVYGVNVFGKLSIYESYHTNAVFNNDVAKIKYIEKYYGDAVCGSARVDDLLSCLAIRSNLTGIDVYIHLFRLGHITVGIEKTFVVACYDNFKDANTADVVEKLYNVVCDSLDRNIVKNLFVESLGYLDIDTAYFLESVDLLPDTDGYITKCVRMEPPLDIKKFIERYNPSQKTLTGLLGSYIYLDNTEAVKHLLSLNIYFNGHICHDLDLVLHRKQYAMLDILAEHIDKMLPLSSMEYLRELAKYLHSKGHSLENLRCLMTRQNMLEIIDKNEKFGKKLLCRLFEEL